jgi:hypothetical protein
MDLALEPWAFADAAQTRWPDAETDQAGWSGIACAIVVLRHLLSLFDPEARQHFVSGLRESATKNRLLEQALLRSDDDALLAFCAGIEADAGADSLGFMELMENEVMQETVWDTDEFGIFSDVSYHASSAAEWGPVPADFLQPPGSSGLIEWDRRGVYTLADRIEEYFGTYDHDETGAQLRRSANIPRVIRVHYRAGVQDSISTTTCQTSSTRARASSAGLTIAVSPPSAFGSRQEGRTPSGCTGRMATPSSPTAARFRCRRRGRMASTCCTFSRHPCGFGPRSHDGPDRAGIPLPPAGNKRVLSVSAS